MTGATPDPSKGTPRLGADFNTRVLSALAMGIVALAATWAGSWFFTSLAVIGALILIWEWAGIHGRSKSGPEFQVQYIATAGTIVTAADQMSWYLGAPAWLVIWGAGVATLFALERGVKPSPAVIALCYFALPAAALAWFRNSPELGLTVIIYLFVVVWATDILAYVCGRLFGGPKLWPAVSPKKTWSGAIGGTLAAVIGGILIAATVPGASLFRIAVLSLVLSVVSQIGDLVESAVKRRHGVKDSSNLIPGHGGLLDRVDGLLFATAAAALFVLIFGDATSPGPALLIGSVAP